MQLFINLLSRINSEIDISCLSTIYNFPTMNRACCEILWRMPYLGQGRYTEDIKSQFLSWHRKCKHAKFMFMLSGIGVDMNTTKVVVLFFSHWRHNEHDGFSNHRRLDCLLNRSSAQLKRKHQSSASLAFVSGIHTVNSSHKSQWRGKCHHLMTSSCPIRVFSPTY